MNIEAQDRRMLALLAVVNGLSVKGDDYKDLASAMSGELSNALEELECMAPTMSAQREAQELRKLASKLRLLDGYNCPRATLEAFDALTTASYTMILGE